MDNFLKDTANKLIEEAADLVFSEERPNGKIVRKRSGDGSRIHLVDSTMRDDNVDF